MSGQRSSSGGLGRGVLISGGLSALFLGIAAVTSPVVAALVVLPAAILAGVLRAGAVPQSTAHTLVTPKFASVSVIHAPRSAEAVTNEGAAPAA